MEALTKAGRNAVRVYLAKFELPSGCGARRKEIIEGNLRRLATDPSDIEVAAQLVCNLENLCDPHGVRVPAHRISTGLTP